DLHAAGGRGVGAERTVVAGLDGRHAVLDHREDEVGVELARAADGRAARRADLARDLLLDRAARGDLLARLRAARDLTEAARLAAAAAARAGADLPGARAVGVLYARRAREDVEGVGRHRAVGERVAERAAAIAEHTHDEALGARPDRRDDAR